MIKDTSTNQINKKHLTEMCGMTLTVSMIGGRWKLNILGQLLSAKTLSYSDLRGRLPGISEKMLYQQLIELMRDGLVHKKTMPAKVAYSLTDLGSSLEEILLGMYKWGHALNEKERLKSITR